MRLAITTGEPAGIGPEVALAALDALPPGVQATLLGDAAVLERARRLVQGGRALPSGVDIEPLAAPAPVEPGRLDPRNGRHVLALLDRAIDGALVGRYDAIVTAPVHKGVINDAGVPFTGHTEYLAERTRTPHVVMLLASEAGTWQPPQRGAGPAGAPPRADGPASAPLRVALATTHLPLREVPRAITAASLAATLDVLDRDLRHRFGLAAPRIAVCGLNPHAGEGGHLGREEIDTIAPAIAAARARGIAADGPHPADTIFVPAHAAGYDAILAMYHDQGLAPFKQASFGIGVNVTLGLPFVRTSVDHGTALDLAGSGRAEADSLRAALRLAARLAARAAAPR